MAICRRDNNGYEQFQQVNHITSQGTYFEPGNTGCTDAKDK